MANKINLNWKSNLKSGFGKDALIGNGLSAFVAIWYCIVPTLLKLDGWLGWIVGWGVPFLVGKAINAPSVSDAAIGIGTVHFIMTKGNGLVQEVFGRPIWALEPANSPATTPPVNPNIPNLPNLPGTRGIAEYVSAVAPGEQYMTPYSISQIEAMAQNPGVSSTWNVDGRQQGVNGIVDAAELGQTDLPGQVVRNYAESLENPFPVNDGDAIIARWNLAHRNTEGGVKNNSGFNMNAIRKVFSAPNLRLAA